MKMTKNSESKFLLPGCVERIIRVIIESRADLASGELELSPALLRGSDATLSTCHLSMPLCSYLYERERNTAQYTVSELMGLVCYGKKHPFFTEGVWNIHVCFMIHL